MPKYLIQLDSEEMARRGRLGALKVHATYDSKYLTAAARGAFRAKFEREVDPDGVLTVPERQRRADAARREHYRCMARLSVEARRRKRLTGA